VAWRIVVRLAIEPEGTWLMQAWRSWQEGKKERKQEGKKASGEEVRRQACPGKERTWGVTLFTRTPFTCRVRTVSRERGGEGRTGQERRGGGGTGEGILLGRM
jgi:hypothetical protein